MNWSLRRQLLYFGVIFGVLATIIILIVWRKIATKPETCFDNTQNQDERGVDCGGVCDLVCIDDVRPLAIQWKRALPVTDDVYNAVAYVQNTNVAAGVRDLPYEFLLYDQNNILIAERRGSTVIGPNQDLLVFEPGIVVGNRVPSLVDFRFSDNQTWEDTEERFATQSLITSSVQWERLDTTPTLRATVLNTAVFDVRDVRLVAIAYDAQGNAIATSQTWVDLIKQGTEWSGAFTWPQPFEKDIARTQIISHLDIFDQPRF